MSKLLGAVLHDTYRIERRIGRGGMGEVYLASHLRLPRQFAIKVLFSVGGGDEVKRFRREAEVASSLGHPHIVEVIDFNTTDEGAPYLVMEYLEGEDLAARLIRTPRLPLTEVARILKQMSSALQAAHRRGIVHRDLKPRNIFLCRKDDDPIWVKIVDFGLSKVSGAHTAVTHAQVALGTPRFMSPEQALGKSAKADARTDIFAVGSILYNMLAGQHPFPGQTLQIVLHSIVHLDPPSLSSMEPGIPEGVSRVVARALRKDPADRYQSMEELCQEFLQGAGLQESAASGLVAVSAGAKSSRPPSRADLQATMVARRRVSEPADDSGDAGGDSAPEGTEELGSSEVRDLVEGSASEPGAARREGTEELRSAELRSLAGAPAEPVAERSSEPEVQPVGQRPASTSMVTPRLPWSRAGLVLIPAAVLVGVGLWLGLRLAGPQPLPVAPEAEPAPIGSAPVAQPLAAGLGPTKDSGPRRGAQRAAPGVPASQPTAEPSPTMQITKLKPPVRPPAAAVRPGARRSRPARLRVVTLAEGKLLWADLFVDGVRVGQTPVTLDRLQPGPHQLEARRQGYPSAASRVTLRPGTETKVVLELQK